MSYFLGYQFEHCRHTVFTSLICIKEMTFYDRYELKITCGDYGSIMIIYIKLIPVKCLVFYLSVLALGRKAPLEGP